MFVTVLGKLADINNSEYVNYKFTDVDATAYYTPFVAWATEHNIVIGTSSSTFSPDQSITREEMAVIMNNYAQSMGYVIPQTREGMSFTDDASIELWASESVRSMQHSGMIMGKDGNRFDPKGSTSRAEASTVLRHFTEIVVDVK